MRSLRSCDPASLPGDTKIKYSQFRVVMSDGKKRESIDLAKCSSSLIFDVKNGTSLRYPVSTTPLGIESFSVKTEMAHLV